MIIRIIKFRSLFSPVAGTAAQRFVNGTKPWRFAFGWPRDDLRFEQRALASSTLRKSDTRLRT